MSGARRSGGAKPGAKPCGANPPERTDVVRSGQARRAAADFFQQDCLRNLVALPQAAKAGCATCGFLRSCAPSGYGARDIFIEVTFVKAVETEF